MCLVFRRRDIGDTRCLVMLVCVVVCSRRSVCVIGSLCLSMLSFVIVAVAAFIASSNIGSPGTCGSLCQSVGSQNDRLASMMGDALFGYASAITAMLSS